MKNFVIFFDGREGTSALVRLLNNFDQVSILHHDIKSGWEPFAPTPSGSIPLHNLKQCLEIVFNGKPIDIDRLNQIYTKTAKRPITIKNPNGAIGFKMRFEPPNKFAVTLRRIAVWYRVGGTMLRKIYNSRFEKMMIELFKKNDVAVFFVVRQDVLRWALSIYHAIYGDKAGKRGNLQWKLVNGEISKDKMGKTKIDCKKLERIILRCEQSLAIRHEIRCKLEQAGIKVYSLMYEDFLQDKQSYLQRVFEILEIPITEEEINAAINKGAFFQKVHSNQLSDFVENHQQVMEKFRDRFAVWS